MAREEINIGTNPNDGTGDNLRQAMEKTNRMFAELYSNSGSVSGDVDGGNASTSGNGTIDGGNA